MFKSSVSVFFICFFLSVSSQHNHESHRVNVDVYYESLCPDSIKFFTKQLYPSLQGNLSNFVNLTLVPYGKTTQQIDSVNEIRFTCHHGPDECQGNKIQACALKIIDRLQPNTDNLGYNRVTVAFINCLMDKVDRTKQPVEFPIEECAAINQVTSVADIKNCINYIDGKNYLSALGNKTAQFQNPLKSVPTIVFNGRYSDHDNQLAQTNFIRALCQYVSHDQPAECLRSGASALSVPVVAVITSVLFYML